LVLAVWFTCRSSTGSRRADESGRRKPHGAPGPTCAAPATVRQTGHRQGSEPPDIDPAALKQPLSALNKCLGRPA
jgi:hypothetical protein